MEDEYDVVEFLKTIFGKRKMIRRYSLGAEGIFNLLYTDKGVYQFKFKDINKLPASDGAIAQRDNLKNKIVETIVEAFKEKNIKCSVTGGKFINIDTNGYMAQIEVIKKISIPSNLGQVRIDGEWI